MTATTFALVLSILTFGTSGTPVADSMSQTLATGLTQDQCQALRNELGQQLGSVTAQLSNGVRVWSVTSCQLETD